MNGFKYYLQRLHSQALYFSTVHLLALSIALLLISSNVLAKTNFDRPDLEREKRMASEVEDAVLDGEVISAPTIQSHISGGSGIITGRFTVEESTKLAVLLRAGALPAKMTFLQERTIGPELGQDSIDAGKIAAIVAAIGVLVFMILSYGMFGLFADIALIINVGLIFGLLSMIGATLTLPGIAGIVLTVGMAVDANVLIFERIREEIKAGRGPARAIELGYEKALSAILDANITTFITAVILFVMGSGPVRGFAITLGLGIITSVFTAIFVTRLIVIIWFERRKPKEIEV